MNLVIKGLMPNQLNIDPTRTTILRRRFVADMTRRFKKISKAIRELVVDDDAFGLAPGDSFLTLTNQQVARQAWRFRTNAQKVAAFRKWLEQQVNAGILSPVGGIGGKPWTAPYIESAYKKGAIRAYTDLRKDELAAYPSLFKGGQAEFIRTAFESPEVTQKIELLYERAFNELKGITAVMEQQLSRTLAEGLVQGYGADKIARNLVKNVSNITRTRANVLARTEIIRSHAEGQLDSFERLGVKELRLMAEWSTAGDERVCALCADLDGIVMTIEEARGLLPRHPNCRCMWLPANKERMEKGQMWGKDKDAAIARSIQKEAPKTIKRSVKEVRRRSPWLGKEVGRAVPVHVPAPKPEVAVPKPKPKIILSDDEAKAIRIWADADKQYYKDIIAWDKNHSKGLGNLDRTPYWHQRLRGAMDKIGPSENTVYRGMGLSADDMSMFVPGNTFKTTYLSAYSGKKNIALDFARNTMREHKVLLEARLKSGVNISSFTKLDEAEFLLSKNKMMRVISSETIESQGDIIIKVILEEI